MPETSKSLQVIEFRVGGIDADSQPIRKGSAYRETGLGVPDRVGEKILPTQTCMERIFAVEAAAMAASMAFLRSLKQRPQPVKQGSAEWLPLLPAPSDRANRRGFERILDPRKELCRELAWT